MEKENSTKIPMADWASLDRVLLVAIAKKIPSAESYESFAEVCKSWEGAARNCLESWELARKRNFNQTIFEGPWLMFAEIDEEESREFCSVSLGMNRTRKIFLPEAKKQRCVSCKDWLVMNCPNELEASLLHPLSGVQIHLPKLNTLPNYERTSISHFIEKAVISANPATNSDYIVIILCNSNSHLGFWKFGDTSWTSISRLSNSLEDIIYSNNDKKLYCLDELGRIISCDIHGPDPTRLCRVSDVIPRGHNDEWADKAYLVELSRGKFLVVRKFVFLDDDLRFYRTERFKIFEVNIEEGTCVEVHDLGNKALFLGYNTSFFIECSKFNNCMPNCIYFSDDVYDYYMSRSHDEGFGAGKDMGIYRVSDGSIIPLYDDKIGRSRITPPTCIGPSF